jgi:predicted ATPase
MLKSLKITNFRCFEEFDLQQLGRVNLLVGKNNTGKTSILEALHILSSPYSLNPFLDIIDCRGEYSLNEKDSNRAILKVNHLFHGYQTEDKMCFHVSGFDDKNSKVKFSFRTTDRPADMIVGRTSKKYDRWQIFNTDDNLYMGDNYLLEWEDASSIKSVIILPSNISIYRMKSMSPEYIIRSQLVSLVSSDSKTVIKHFNEIVLTPQEEILYESLRTIEPGIERIAPISDQGYSDRRNGGFVVSINKQRVPIGSMGYGIWRMLEITLAMVNIPGGTLLIDEIDTGLHFSVMVDLWKLICKTAEKLDIQVFATTHNSDCWKSLAEVANSDDIASDDITIHRIERGKKASIVFNEQEMAIAADRDIEVR